MVTVLVYLLVGLNIIASIMRPWIGVVASYVFALLQPHTIWWWAFTNVRPIYSVLLPTLIGFVKECASGRIDFTILKTKLNRCMIILWICFVLSYYFGPYVHVVNPFRFYDSDALFGDLNKTYLTYFLAALLLTRLDRLKFAALAAVVAVVYLTYWANAEYLTHGLRGRMHGPLPLSGYSIYKDENVFGTLFVLGIPFIYYAGKYIRNKVVSIALWCVIPFAWHAVFLTASRGALLGCGMTVLVFALRSEKKAAGAFIVALFVAAFAWQAGDIMKSRSSTIANYEEETSASARIDAWVAATKMMGEHPLTGVGFASFGQAFPDYSTQVPRVAHNTVFQIAGEWGLVAVVTYLTLILAALNGLRKNGLRLRRTLESDEDRLRSYLNEATYLGLVGFLTCSMFLSLDKYDMLYYLIVMANGTLLCTGYWRRDTVPSPAVPRAWPAGRPGVSGDER